MSEPSEWAMTEAAKLVRQIAGEVTRAWTTADRKDADANERKARQKVARALDAALAVQPGCVRLPDGREVKVLGTLPRLADGSLYGGVSDDYKIERLWAVQPTSKEIFECNAMARWSELDDWRVHRVESDITNPLSWCYSTRAAAEAAAKEGETP